MERLLALVRSVDRRYFGRRLRRWYSRYFVLGERWAEFWDAVEERTKPGMIVLDAGAGEARQRARFPAARYVAVDNGVGEHAWDYANLDAMADLEALPFRSSSVDLIVCVQVLEHLPHPQEALQEMGRVLRTGGSLFLSTNHVWPQHQKPHDYFRFTSFGLRRLLAEAGFRTEWVWPMGGAFACLRLSLAQVSSVVAESRVWWVRPLVPLAWLGWAMLPVLGPLLYLLDRLDQNRDYTLGYFCLADKPEQPKVSAKCRNVTLALATERITSTMTTSASYRRDAEECADGMQGST